MRIQLDRLLVIGAGAAALVLGLNAQGAGAPENSSSMASHSAAERPLGAPTTAGATCFGCRVTV